MLGMGRDEGSCNLTVEQNELATSCYRTVRSICINFEVHYLLVSNENS